MLYFLSNCEEQVILVASVDKFAKVFNIGFSVAASIVAPTLGGVWLDKKLHTKVLFTIVLVILGTILAFYQLYRIGVDNSDT